MREVEGLVNIKTFKAEDGKDDIIIEVNEDLIKEKGEKALSEFLQ